jgi:hypothetical protein
MAGTKADALGSNPGPARGGGSNPPGGTHVDPRRLIVHCKKEPFDVYIGRPGPWGNPFSHLPKTQAEFRVETREEAIACFEEWLRQLHPELIERAKQELRGKVLGCWCHPKACHGDVLARIANEP